MHVGQEMPLIERTRMTFESVRLISRTLGTASLLGLFLSALGLYATLAFAVRRRTRELGIRTALGALPKDLLRLVLGEGMRLVAVGLAVDWVAAFGGTRILTAYLYGVEARDPLTFGAVALLLVCVALVASSVPALMATRVAPATALRHE